MTDLVGSERFVVRLSEELKLELQALQDKYYKKIPVPGQPGKYKVQGTKALGETAAWPKNFCQLLWELYQEQWSACGAIREPPRGVQALNTCWPQGHGVWMKKAISPGRRIHVAEWQNVVDLCLPCRFLDASQESILTYILKNLFVPF